MKMLPTQRTAASRRKNRKSTSRALESLERRQLLTTTLYIDYGDRFVGGVYNTTVGELDNTTAAGNPNIDGPRLSNDSGTAFSDATALKITAVTAMYSGSTLSTLRGNMDIIAKRAYEGADVTVVDLTSSFQTVNGHSVRAAANFTEASQTLGINEGDTENNDAYVFVGKFEIGASLYNPAFSAYGGIATGTDIGANNNNDGSAVVCLLGSGDTYQFNGCQVAHEAGHTLGLRHIYRQGTVSAMTNTTATVAQYDLLHQSEVMSYLGYDTLGGYNMFDRYPMMSGDGNTNANVLSSTAGTPMDQFINDPNIGPSTVTYVTGTGENDIIKLTKLNATTAQVDVSAFDNSAHTTTIDAPGATGNTFTYNIALNKPILLDAGGRNDLIQLVGDFGTSLTIRGMQGDDSLNIDAQSASLATYTPAATQTTGIDGNPDYRGTITYGATTVNFQEFETTSSVRIVNVNALSMVTPATNDSIALTNSSGDANVAGSSSGTSFVPLKFASVNTFTLDAATNNGASAIDNITVTPGALSGVLNIIINTGGGNDVLSFTGTSTPTNVTFNSAGGDDTLSVTNPGSGVTLFFGGGSGNNTATLQSGAWALGSDLGANGTVVMNVNVNGGNITFNATQHLSALALSTGTQASMPANGTRVLVVKALSINGTAKLDLFNNDMILDYTGSSPSATFRMLLQSGYNNGLWNGNGITSSTAQSTAHTQIGFAEATQVFGSFPASFAGQSVDNTSLLFRFTRAGDANLDRKVDVADLGALATNWQQSPRITGQGDFDYSGTVDVADLGILSTNWQQSITVPGDPLGRFSSTPIRGKAMSVDQLAELAGIDLAPVIADAGDMIADGIFNA